MVTAVVTAAATEQAEVAAATGLVLRRVLCLTALTLICTGCGTDDSLPARAPVAGTVFYQGQPVEQGTITFHPEDESVNPASSSLGAGGEFQLSTFERHDGAIPGQFTVVITAREDTADVGTVPQKSLIPEKYSDLQSSPLKITIPEEGNEELSILLED